MLSEICDKLSCAPVHHLGKTLILFRQLPGNIKPAALAALEPERPAKRRASEPHTPKKLAAEGKTLSKRPARRADPDEARPSRRASRPASSTRTASPCARAPARHPAAPTRFRAARRAQPARRSPQRHQPPLVVQALSPEQAKPSGAAPVCAGTAPPGLSSRDRPRRSSPAQRHPTPGSGRTRNPRQQNGRITRPIHHKRSACYRGLPMSVKFNLWCFDGLQLNRQLRQM